MSVKYSWELFGTGIKFAVIWTFCPVQCAAVSIGICIEIPLI